WLQPAAEDGRFARGNGRIEATEVDVATKAAGRVSEILVNEGDFVDAGQELARMDTKSLEAQHAQARAEVANARSARESALALVAQRIADVAMAESVLIQAEAELDVARRTSQRLQNLLGQKAASAQQADDAAARARTAEASLRVA